MDLRFDGRIGARPEPESDEALFLAACAREDKRLWREVNRLSIHDIEDVIETLRGLGWGFEWVTLH